MRTNNLTLVFDMDGTIADFYGVENWLEDLHNSNTRPYRVAKPLWDMDTLEILLNILRGYGVEVVVTTWLAKGSTKDYEKETSKAKIEWLRKYNFPVDKINCVSYGTPKTTCTREKGGYQILFDDSQEVRNEWNLGKTVDPTKENILEFLTNLIIKVAEG